MEQKSRGRPRTHEVQAKGEVARVFGELVTQRREQLNMTQQELRDALAAQGLDVHITTIAKIERGTRPTSMDEAAVITRVLGMSLSLSSRDPARPLAPSTDPAASTAGEVAYDELLRQKDQVHFEIEAAERELAESVEQMDRARSAAAAAAIELRQWQGINKSIGARLDQLREVLRIIEEGITRGKPRKKT